MTHVISSSPVADAIDSLGGDTAVAKLAGLKTSWAVAKWRVKLPAERTIWLAEQTGYKYTPHMLNPVMYPNATDGLPSSEPRSVVHLLDSQSIESNEEIRREVDLSYRQPADPKKVAL
jgi:hypothetical protein